MPTLATMADQKFVSLTTFRRSGAPVATPVWIASDGDALVVTTSVDTGKVKRLRHDPRVALRPCTRFGAVAEGAPTVGGVAEVVAPNRRATDALRRKYGLQYRFVLLLERTLKRRAAERVILRITEG